MRVFGFLLLLAILPGVRAQCYLEGAYEDCTVCWSTVYSSTEDTTGERSIAECPASIRVTWDALPPEEMFEGASYPVQYSIKIAPALQNVTLASDKTTTIAHANIHSCVASAGACTPFIANTPGLSTHTAELRGDFDATGKAIFESDMTLSPEMYTIIGHVRFYEPNALDRALPPTKIDACIGLQRTVTALERTATALDVVTTPVVEASSFPVAGIAGIAAGVSSNSPPRPGGNPGANGWLLQSTAG